MYVCMCVNRAKGTFYSVVQGLCGGEREREWEGGGGTGGGTGGRELRRGRRREREKRMRYTQGERGGEIRDGNNTV